ncbi:MULTISPECIES: hypothetical protein [unclassified Coleofasciculus]|uniref:hypothetical protein n=1 Tax=unclassified Coleofasciculus TaxID=2692782 RepID=UPI001881E295|nr:MULTISPECIES: hypothetical protein [unclassified Coleofasciculus]MBE9126959.1 hypothetical protein [Coleofasciculus sp. LEGE 07081]MBE9150265.1 hypothetical protein [Coleofasciculus sp. LEGE 07092]
MTIVTLTQRWEMGEKCDLHFSARRYANALLASLSLFQWRQLLDGVGKCEKRVPLDSHSSCRQERW